MILDLLKNAKQYAGIHPGVDRALEEMVRFTPENYGDGRVEVDGDNVFLLLNNYETHPKSESMAEAHRKYIDVMYMVEGAETIYVKNVDKLSCITEEYAPLKCGASVVRVYKKKREQNGLEPNCSLF